MKKLSIPFILLVIFLLLVTACNNNNNVDSDSTNSKNDKVTLELDYWTDNNMENLFKQAVEILNKDHPNVDVNIVAIPHDNYWTKMKTAISGGSGGDIFMINGPNFPQFKSLGLIEDLQPFIDKSNYDMNNYPKGIENLYKADGDYYGIPFYEGALALYYNKALFDKAGISYPDENLTWDDIKKNGKALANTGKINYGIVFSFVGGQEGIYPLIHQAGGFIISEDHIKSGFGTPEATKAISFGRDLIKEGISPSEKITLQTDPKQLFASGRVAMYPSGSWNLNLFKKSLGDKLGIAVLPHDQKRGYLLHGSSFVMNSNSKHKQEAWELIKILGDLEEQKNLAKDGANFPANVNAVDTWEKANSSSSINLQAFKDGLADTEPYPVSLNTQQWLDVIDKELADAMLGKISPEEASKNIQKQMDEILAKEK